MVERDGSRGRSIVVRGAIFGVAVALLVGAMITNGELRTLRAQQAARDAVAAELASTHGAIMVALDSTEQQLAMLRHLLGWLEETEDASSTGLIESLSRLRTRHRAPAAVDAIGELVWTGRLVDVPDASLRRRLVALRRHLAAASAAGEAEFERYRVRLEELLSPGMWRHVFQRESGRHAVDYRAQLSDLHAAGFDRTLRSLLRGLDEHRNALRGLAAETGALLAEFDRGDADASAAQ